MDTYWGRFCWQSENVEIPEDAGIESIFLSTAELHWTSGSQHIFCERKDHWVVFLFGAIFEQEKQTNPPCIIAGILDSVIRGVPVKDILQNLDGVFSLIIWNDLDRHLYIATDPFGLTKIYYTQDKYGVYVTSHPRNLHRYGLNLEISGDGITMLFSFKGIIAPYSFFKNVYVLKPSELLEFRQDSLSSHEYWQIIDEIQNPYNGDYATAQEELVGLISNTLRNIYHKSKTNPIGVFLSGGVDSALLLSLLQSNDIPSIAYTVGYNPTTTNDESSHAIANAKKIGVMFSALHPTDEELLSLLDIAVQAMPEPCADATILPKLYLTNASHPITRFIDGTGADSIFGGEKRFRGEELAKKYLSIPKLIRKQLLYPSIQSFPSSRQSKISNWIRSAQKFSTGAELTDNLRFIYWFRFLSEECVKKLILPEYFSSSEFINSLFQKPINEASFLNNELKKFTYVTIKTTRPIYSMQKLQTVQLATGATIFTPFISKDLVPWVLRLPQEFVASTNKKKIILRDVLQEQTANRQLTFAKASFSPPLDRWLSGVFKEEFYSLMDKQEFFERSFLKNLIKQQGEKYRDWQWELWLVYIVLKWWERK